MSGPSNDNSSLDAATVERFWSRVDIRGHDECWVWKASRRGGGYGSFVVNKRLENAHRIAWEIANGRPATRGLDMMHACDNRACCNPAHLSEGTRSDNMRDMHTKGRGDSRVGSRHPMARLTEQAVLTIRELAARGVRRKTIAEEYGVKPSAIHDIVSGRSWTHLLAPEARNDNAGRRRKTYEKELAGLNLATSKTQATKS